jgi:hypothetical protein
MSDENLNYTPLNTNINDLLNDLEQTEPPMNLDLRNLMENAFPGGIEGMQKMVDAVQPIMEQRAQLGERAQQIIEESGVRNQVDGNTTLEELGPMLGNMFKSLGEDEEFVRDLTKLQDQYRKVGNKLKDDFNI